MSSKYFFKIGDNHPLVQVLRQFLYSRSYLKKPLRQICSTIFDQQMQVMISEYKKLYRLDRNLNIFTIGSVLNVTTYAQIGSEMSDAQISSVSMHDDEIKRLLYGDPCADWDTIGPILAKDQFIGWEHPGITKNCFDYCVAQLRTSGRRMKSTNWTKDTIAKDIYQLYMAESIAGMKRGAQSDQFFRGIKYLKRAIKAKIPVVVGIDNRDDFKKNRDKTTDHFVTVVGMGSDNIGKYFYFYDNATSSQDAGTSDKNRLYPNCATFMIVGSADNRYAQKYRNYIVTQIRESE